MPQGIAQGDPFTISASGDFSGHRNESIAIDLDWTNAVMSDLEIEINIECHNSLQVIGLSSGQITFSADKSGVITIYVIAENGSQFGNLPLNFTFDDGNDWSERIELMIAITPYSDLSFGSSSGSKFRVDQVSRINVATNFTNAADYTDIVDFTLHSDSGWKSGWTNSDSITLNPGGIDLIRFWIETPPVIDSSPLSGEGASFVLKGISSLDGESIEWQFSVVLDDFHNVSIDEVGDDLTLDPGLSGRIEVNLRNSGNIPSAFSFSLSPLYENGAVVPGFDDNNIIEYNDWSVALYNTMQSTILQPGETRQIDVGFLAPMLGESSLQVRLNISPKGYESAMKSVELTVATQQIRMAEIVIDSQECAQVSPIESCTIFYQLNHQGNMYDNLTVELSQIEGISAQTSQETWGVEIGGSVRNLSLNITSIAGTIAYSNYTLTLNLLTSDGLLLDSKTISGYIGPRIEWVFEYTASAVDAEGKLSMTMVVRNDGNTIDGLIVRLSSTHFTDMSFIPPVGSIFEESEKIRSFEMTNISIGDNFTLRAWIVIPDDQSNDGTIYANITAHSRLDDSNPLYYQAEADYLAVDIIVEEGVIIEVLSDGFQYSLMIIKAWWYIVFSVLIAGLIVRKAANDRRLRMEDPMLAILGTKNIVGEGVDEEGLKEINHQPALAMDREEFTQRFQSLSAVKTYETQKISGDVVRAAETIIDHHEENIVRQKLNHLTSEISSGVVQPHAANLLLDNNENLQQDEKPTNINDDLDF
jgi:hypothetical protein